MLFKTVLAVVTALLLVVVIHELGHALAARLFGVRVREFSIGFGRGPTLWTTKGGTRVKLGWVPLGGYVRLGEKDDDQEAIDHRASFGMLGKTTWLGHSVITLAGVAVNLVVGFGIMLLLAGWRETADLVGVLLGSVGNGFLALFTDPGSNDALASPVGAVDIISSDPTMNIPFLGLLFVFFLGFNISLGVINLVPLPMLDGGHFVLGTIEHIRGRIFSRRTQMGITLVNAFVFFGLTLSVFWSDIVRLFS